MKGDMTDSIVVNIYPELKNRNCLQEPIASKRDKCQVTEKKRCQSLKVFVFCHTSKSRVRQHNPTDPVVFYILPAHYSIEQ